MGTLAMTADTDAAQAQLQIRAMGADIDEARAVVELLNAIPQVALRDFETPELIARFAADPFSVYFVAYLDGKLVGALLGSANMRSMIYHLGVRKGYRDADQKDLDIGTRLVQAALTRFLEIGVPHVLLAVTKANTGGQKFWEAVGIPFDADDNLHEQLDCSVSLEHIAGILNA